MPGALHHRELECTVAAAAHVTAPSRDAEPALFWRPGVMVVKGLARKGTAGLVLHLYS